MKYSSYRNLKRRNALKKYHKKLEELAKLDWYPSPAYWKDGVYVKRLYRGKCSSYAKHQASRAFRRYKDSLAHGSSFKKTYDFWWTIT